MADRLLIKQKEACEQLGISRVTLIREITEGRLRYVLVGKRRKFKPEDLTSYVERQGRGLDGGHPAPIGRGVAAGRPAPGGVVEFDEILERAGRAPRGTGRRRTSRPRDHRPAGRRKKPAPSEGAPHAPAAEFRE
jgi:excisionase family DNA binding protein